MKEIENIDLEYNSEREKLIIPEYGRHIQKLVDFCVKIEDKTERNKMAQAIVDVMGNLQTHLRDVPDFKHKLWDQLYIMSNFKLDVESPYTKPEKEVLQAKPSVLPYPKTASKYRFYGNNIQTMIDSVIKNEKIIADLKDENNKNAEIIFYIIANHMKKCYLNWNKDTVDDIVILRHLKEMSKGKIDLTNKKEPLADIKAYIPSRNPKTQNNQKHQNNQRRRK